MSIRDYRKYTGVRISQDSSIYKEQMYLGNGQGCGTFWFKDLKEARIFIDEFRDKIKITGFEHVDIVPEELCKKCKCHYSFETKEWKKAKDYACKDYKKKLKKEANKKAR